MSTYKTATTLLAAVGVLGLSNAALADCSGEIGTVRSNVMDVCYDGGLILERNGDRTCAGLVRKLDEADKKISEDKILDAIQKLEDFQVTWDSLYYRPKAKISAGEYDYVNDPLQTAKVCVVDLL